MKTVVMYPLYQSITFWICVAFFIYFTGNFFYILFASTANADAAFGKQLVTIYGIVTITKNIILSLALLANEPTEQTEEILNIPTDLNLDDFTLTNPKNQ
jgi:hypothetical protein